MECGFCHNKFKTKSSLNNHQKTAKYCISKQSNKICFECDFCDKKYSSKYGLSKHIINCKQIFDKIKEKTKDTYINKYKEYEDKIKFLENMLGEKDDHIKDLEKQMRDVALKAVSRPTTKNTQINTYIQQLQPLTDQHLTDNVQHLTIDHILKGPEGYAQYALEYPLKDRMICVDYSRRKVKFKDKDGNVITDPEMTNLATKFFNSIKGKNKDLIVECSDKLKENFGDEIDTIVKIFDYKAGVDNGSDGTKTEFQHNFVKYMCGQTLKE